MKQELGHTGICRWEGARIRGRVWPRLGMPSISNSCSGQIPSITSVKGGRCGGPQVGLGFVAVPNVKIPCERRYTAGGEHVLFQIDEYRVRRGVITGTE